MDEPQQNEELLQRYFDGELTEAETREVERWIAHSEEAQSNLRMLKQIRELIRLGVSETSETVDSSSWFETVVARRDQDEPARSDDAGHEADAEPPSLADERKARVIATRRRSILWSAGAITSMAAASLIALVALREPPPDVSTDVGEVIPSAGETESTAEPEDDNDPKGSRVVEVEFGDRSGTVFDVEDEDEGTSTAVIWIDDDDDDDEL